MKKFAMTLLGALAVLGCGCIFPTQLAPTPTASAATDAIYLGQSVARGLYQDGVWQSYASIGRGEPASRYAFESGENNKFLRMANFGGAPDCTSASVVFACEGGFTAAAISFRYRFSEGECAYGADAPVFTAELRGVTHTLTYGELTPSVSEDLTWHTVSFPVQGLAGEGRLTLTFHFPAAGPNGSAGFFADIDDVSVLAGEEEGIAHGDFEFASVSASDEKVYEALARGSREKMLSGEDAARYEENTVLEHALRTDFNDGLYSAPLARQGGSGTFHTAANATAGGSDIYAVYDPYGENTFLRFSNSNGKIQETQLTTYFYDNATGVIGNMPVTEQIHFSFRYRLFIDDYIRAGMRGDEVILHLSTRSSAINHAGEISLDELVLNEAGDDTWHTFSSVLDVRRSTTDHIIFTYYAHADSSFASTTFLDLDDLRLAPSGRGANYAHLNGTFEGLAEGGEMGQVYYRSELGAPAQKRAKNSLDGEMLLSSGQTFSIHADMPRTSNVYYASFDVDAPEGASLEMRLGGRSGDRLPLTVGQDAEGDLTVAWERRETWRCRLYYARAAYGPVTSWDFVNTGSEPVGIDNFYAGQVVSVSAEAGDFAAYTARITACKEQFGAGDIFTTSSRLALDRLLLLADRITEYSSAARMEAAASALESGIASAAHRADMTALQAAIEEAERTLALRDPATYEKQIRMQFLNALSAARAVTDEDGQTAVDGAAEALRTATAALAAKETGMPAETVALVAVGTGGAAVGLGSLVAVCLTKRRFL